MSNFSRLPLRIGVMGSGVCDKPLAGLAEDVGRRIAEAEAILICGGRGGVMEAACRGARLAGGITLGILPGESPGEANPYVLIPIPTGLGHARNVVNIWASDSIIAIGGEYGTLSEIAVALKVGVPVVGLDTWTFANRPDFRDPLLRAVSAEEAVKLALDTARRRRAPGGIPK